MNLRPSSRKTPIEPVANRDSAPNEADDAPPVLGADGPGPSDLLEVARSHVIGRERSAGRVGARILAFVIRRCFGEMNPGPRWLPSQLASRLRTFLQRGAAHDVVYEARSSAPSDGPWALLVSHDLSASGGPKIVFELASILGAAGYRVMVVTASDGPFRLQLTEIGSHVLVDRSALRPASTAIAVMRSQCHVAICNTVVTAEAVRTLAPKVPTFWYIHEISLVREMLAADPSLADVFGLVRSVWVGSELAAAAIRPHRADVRVLPYGLAAIERPDGALSQVNEPLKIVVFGSIETRKGQDLAIAAFERLSAKDIAAVAMTFHGRVLEEAFNARVIEAMAMLPNVRMGGELGPDDYRAALLDCDAVLVPSRDDTLPIVSLDALGASRVLMCTSTTGTSAWLTDGTDGFVADGASAESIATMLTAAIDKRTEWSAIGAAARNTFDRAFSKDAFAQRILAEVGPAFAAAAAPLDRGSMGR